MHLDVGPFGVLSCFDTRGGGGGSGPFLRLAVQQVLQVIQSQEVIIALQKLLQKLRSIRSRMQSSSFCHLKGSQEKQSGTQQHRAQHGSGNNESREKDRKTLWLKGSDVCFLSELWVSSP
ncbi:hypothetical protein WJF84_25740, partial [Salmonella enterica subsp. enterica serovar Corvallis]